MILEPTLTILSLTKNKLTNRSYNKCISAQHIVQLKIKVGDNTKIVPKT